jgi:hypothetical protein
MPENINDAIPTMGYAITALRRAKGDQKSPYWKNYTDAIAHFTQMHGLAASKQLQEIAYKTAMNKGDLNDELTKFSKTAIDTKQDIHPIIKNMLAMAYDGQKPLEKVTYAFDLPDQPIATDQPPQLQSKLAQLFKK